MIDKEKRVPGTYTEIKNKNINNVIYKITETVKVGKNFEILNFVREYNPPLAYKHV